MSYSQHPTPVKIDNTTAQAFTYNNTAIQKATYWDIQYDWLRSRENKLYLKIYQKKGTDPDDPIIVDYHTKHQSVIYHKGIIHIYVHDKMFFQKEHLMTTASNFATYSQDCKVY